MELLRDKRIIAVSNACLQRIYLLSIFRHGSPSSAASTDSAPENVNIRVFLASIMIAHHRARVFESIGALEQALYASAALLLTTFEKICSCVRSSPGRCFQEVPHELTKDFAGMLSEYLERFRVWKIPDGVKLSRRVRHALIALYQAEEHLPPNEPDDSSLRASFRAQIERLRGKLRHVAGADAVRAFDEQRQAGQAAATGGWGGGAPGGCACTAPPGGMSHEQLAHELLLNPAFQLDGAGGSGVEQRARESFGRGFWDSLADDLRLETPCYDRVLRVLAQVRDGIRDLAGGGEPAGLSEVVDLDFIRQQAEAVLYGWESCTALVEGVVGAIERAQAPGLGAETRAMWREAGPAMRGATAGDRPAALCKGLEFLLERVRAARVDAANSRLRRVAPVVRDHGVEYERGKFQDRLGAGALTLERTQVARLSSIPACVPLR